MTQESRQTVQHDQTEMDNVETVQTQAKVMPISTVNRPVNPMTDNI